MNKITALLIVFLSLALYASAQSNKDSVEIVKNANYGHNRSRTTYTVVDQKAEFIGGQKAFIEYLSKNIVLPPEVKNNGIEGVVYISFILNESGEIEDAAIIKGVNIDYDAEALRLIKNMPKWVPGKQRGEEVAVRVNLPLIFSPTNNISLGSLASGDSLALALGDQMPQYPGGTEALIRYLDKKVIYPQEASRRGVEGVVYLSFIIDKEGNLNDIIVQKGLSKECDEEAIRVVKNMPTWLPGKRGGFPVPVRFSLPIRFRNKR